MNVRTLRPSFSLPPGLEPPTPKPQPLTTEQERVLGFVLAHELGITAPEKRGRWPSQLAEPSSHEDNRLRYLAQSALTKDGEVPELPRTGAEARRILASLEEAKTLSRAMKEQTDA